jgi:succinate-semialdehyde dehydrogenase/glutarate-semialdehyde dehydrogenase
LASPLMPVPDLKGEGTVQTHWIKNAAHAASTAGGTLDIVNPATGQHIDAIPKGDAESADAAVGAARAAFASWSALSPSARRDYLVKAALLIETHCEQIATLLTTEMGKTLAQSRGEVMGAADVVRQMSDLALHLRSGSQMARFGEVNFQQRFARGVAALVVPWNYPVMVGVENAAANLAVGNTVVWKPSEKTPLSSRLVAELAFGHLPAGCLNLLLGDGLGAGDPLVRHAGVDVVVFVGSERTGRRLGELCGASLKKVVLELGGKDPLIIDETVDVAAAARHAALATYTNAGQICTSTERIYIARQSFDAFVDALVRESAAIKLGDGLQAGVQMGPIVDGLQLATIALQVQDAVDRGACLRHGGMQLDRPGSFYPPTVLTGVDAASQLMQQETFGPVAPCFVFDDFDEALTMANDSRYGLSAMVCTSSAPRAIKALHTLNAGMVRINTMRGRSAGATSEPFGASGLGHGYGLEFLMELTRQKSIYWRAELD